MLVLEVPQIPALDADEAPAHWDPSKWHVPQSAIRNPQSASHH